MAQRRSQSSRTQGSATRQKTATKPTKAAAGRDVTQYADKEATAFHKFFARWIVEQVGYVPEDAKSKRSAFLSGVSIATAARQAFQASPELAEWREETGEAKRGPKPKNEAETQRRSQRQNVSDEEFEDDSAEESEEEETDFEDELNSMQIGKLRSTAKEYGVTAERGWKKEDFIDAILAAADESEEDEEEDEDDESDEDAIDLDELADELDALSLSKVKARAKEFGVTPKRGEEKDALIDRILESLEESEDEDDEDEEEEEEENPPAKSRARAGSSGSASTKRKGKPADEDDDEFLF